MNIFWHELLGFVAAALAGTVFFDVFLSIYERKRDDARPVQVRIFRWALKGGIGVGIITAIIQFLLSR